MLFSNKRAITPHARGLSETKNGLDAMLGNFYYDTWKEPSPWTSSGTQTMGVTSNAVASELVAPFGSRLPTVCLKNQRPG